MEINVDAFQSSALEEESTWLEAVFTFPEKVVSPVVVVAAVVVVVVAVVVVVVVVE